MNHSVSEYYWLCMVAKQKRYKCVKFSLKMKEFTVWKYLAFSNKGSEHLLDLTKSSPFLPPSLPPTLPPFLNSSLSHFHASFLPSIFLFFSTSAIYEASPRYSFEIIRVIAYNWFILPEPILWWLLWPLCWQHTEGCYRTHLSKAGHK